MVNALTFDQLESYRLILDWRRVFWGKSCLSPA